MSKTIIETERLILRTPHDGDAEQIHLHCNTPEVMEHLGGVQSAAENAAGIKRMAQSQLDHGHSFWVVEHKKTQDILGFCGIKKTNEPAASFYGEFEAGWRLRADYWRKGIATEAASASLDYAFEHLNAQEIYAMTITENIGSWGMMEKLTMQRRKDLDYISDQYGPEIVYSISKEQWKARPK